MTDIRQPPEDAVLHALATGGGSPAERLADHLATCTDVRGAGMTRAETGKAGGPCWCCGHECMFCTPQHPCQDCHWCALCKVSSCPACCGCPQCVLRRQGCYSPEGAKTSHGGGPVTHDWSEIP